VTTTLLILSVIAPIGAIDVLYYHLYRFRLYRREQCVFEELTHLVRHATFIALVALLARGVTSSVVDHVILALFVVDIINSSADVLLESRSRAELGGLPRGEYFLHFVGTLGAGAAGISYLYERARIPLEPAYGLLAWQSAALVASGTLLFLVESGLFARAIFARRGNGATSVSAW
jgi:hypothetical protein